MNFRQIAIEALSYLQIDVIAQCEGWVLFRDKSLPLQKVLTIKLF